MSNGDTTGTGPIRGPAVETINEEWIRENYRIQQEVNTQLMSGIAAVQAALQTPRSVSEPVLVPRTVEGESTGGRRPKHLLSHPNKFDGTDRAAYPAFRGYLRVKFRIDSEAIGGEPEKVWYGYGYLTGKAAERIFPWLAAAEERSASLRVVDFFAQLDSAFADPQGAQRALEWINSKKQGNQPFREFLQEFEQKLLEAGGWEFSDSVRKGYLRASVSRKIKAQLVAVEEPDTYDALVNQLRRTSDNLEELDQAKSKKGAWAKPYGGGGNPDTGGDMDWEPTPRTAAGSAPYHPRDGRPTAKWVSKEVLDQRRSNQKCLRCGSTDHFVNKCQYGPARRPITGEPTTYRPRAAATTELTPQRKTRKPKPATIVEEELSSDSELDSENE